MVAINRHYLRSFDWITFFISLILASIGLLFIFSATFKPENPYSIFFCKQFFGIISGLFIYLFFSWLDFRTVLRWGYFAYYGVIALLIFTLIKGSVGMGGQRWINIGITRFQPSDIAKLLFPAYVTYSLYAHDDYTQPVFKDFVPILGMLFFSFLLIRKQPDLGTALILAFSGLILLWIAGLNKKFFIISLLTIIISAPFLWKALKPYQKQRILVFLGHGSSQKERYQIEQSKIAIGSGGITGKGYLQGTQNRLNFLPESRTDFIFSVIAEEIGFIGTFTILLLYAALFMHLFFVIITIRLPSIQLLAIGLILPLFLSTLINIAMVIDLLPVVGIPLPLLSYGVTNLWTTFASLGWFNSIAMRQLYSTTRTI